MKIFDSLTAEHTEQLGQSFAERLVPGNIVRLHGDIGVGKTVFVHGVAKYFNCASDVCSPTFAIMNVYNGTFPVYHFDLYRLESEDEIYEAGLYEFLAGDGVSLVEWPELLQDYPDAGVYDVTIEKNPDISEEYRKITIEGEGF
ncbi:MAG: tRNA (adenosine(37)-N6)-threonylcarbamoyltransferase complex ATPase subunit type 1 TsaE [Bacillota bacterium]|nr:tRNA (adenosine(37)-N6)-threonylcarbamoyltransferase complex ATPase subunit type 1 TsaE [Bacillota bacterium]